MLNILINCLIILGIIVAVVLIGIALIFGVTILVALIEKIIGAGKDDGDNNL